MDDFARGRARGMVSRNTTTVRKPPQQLPQQQSQHEGAGEGHVSSDRLIKRGGKGVTTVSRDKQSGDGSRYVIGSRKNLDPSLFVSSTRPDHVMSNKKGESGNVVNMVGSYFRLQCSNSWKLCQYSVTFEPVIDNVRVRKAMLYGQKDTIGEVFIFDGTVLFSTKKLPDKVTQLQTTRNHSKGDEDAKVTITVTLTNELPEFSNISLQLYNIIFRWVMNKIGLTQVGRNYYNPKMKTVIDCNRVSFEMWPGFQTSILQYEKSIMLCTQVSHKLMRTNTVLDALKDIYRDAQREAQRSGGRGRSFKEIAERFLNGQIVLTRYNNKTYKIDGIEWTKNVNDTFQKADGSEISYLEYYSQQYKIPISDKKQPLLISTPKKSDVRKQIPIIRLIPELCTLTGLTDEHRADYSVMKTLAQHTKQGPQKSVQAMCNFIKEIYRNQEASKLLKDWGLRFENNLVQFKARQLAPDTIVFGQKGRPVKVMDNGSWDLRGQALLNTVDLRNWCIVYTRRDENVAKTTVETLLKVSGPLGFRVGRPTFSAVNRDSLDSFHQCLKSMKDTIKDLQLIFVVLPSNSKEKYDSLKTLCCVEFGIPSQFAVSRTLGNQKRLMSVCTKIAIQMSVKLGGEAWSVPCPFKTAMVIGIDSYHDSTRRGASVGGFVSSFNKNLTRWHSQALFQGVNQEFLNALDPCIKAAIMNYKAHNNGALPTQIFLYRDGVGDGQIDFVKNHEIPQIREALNAFTTEESQPKIKLTVIIVTKRISGRFFKCEGSRLSNPSPGTIIDDIVTKNDRYDFYVVSQFTREGTVTPTNFNVIHDECGIKVDYLQRLSYKLCHLYFNWAGTVRVPAPCLYAHKLAFLIGQSVHREAKKSLSDKLYYL